MSYYFTVDSMQGDLNTGIDISATGCTVAIYTKIANHPIAFKYMLSLGFNTVVDDFIALVYPSVDDDYYVYIEDTVGGSSTAIYGGASAGQYDNAWLPIVGTFATSEASRTIYVDDYANSGTNSTSRVTSSLTNVGVGRAPNGGGAPDLVYMAEAAIWNTVLSQSQIESYLAGTAASTIAASNLRAYYPLNADRDTEGTILNEGLDTGGDLTFSGPVYNADHPTITSGSTNTSIVVPTGPLR